MKYLGDCLVIPVAKYITLDRGILSLFKIIASIFTHLLTWLSILSRLCYRKYNSLLSCFCKIEIPMKFAINKKYTFITIVDRYHLRKKAERRKEEKKKSRVQKFRAFGIKMSQFS